MKNNQQKDNYQLVMAKDRHYLANLAKQLKKLDKNSEDFALQQQTYQQKLAKSQALVQARLDSVPTIELNADLPVSQQADTLINAICQHQVIIVAGETGSGKTTQLPKIALLAGRGLTGQIGHTQPRRLAARSVANRIADELGEPLGQSVSFKVRFSEQGSANSLIKLMTDGILLAELTYDKYLSRYDTIIIDEAHERSLNIDFILGYLKNLLPKRPDLKVIITSATLDTKRFADYFSDSKRSVPVINVEGRGYPVEVRYRPLSDEVVKSSDDDGFDDVEENLPLAVYQAISECYADASAKGHLEQADILIFVATEAEIHDLTDSLSHYTNHDKLLRHTQILPLFARQTFAEQQRVFQPTSGRRIIIATNVAETALTVPNIRYVIDLGFARISRYDYRSRVQRLPIEAISQAAANQRKGRCGRIASGVCIRLYSQDDFNSRSPFTEPEILRTNLASVILQMANLGLGDIEKFNFIEPPDGRLLNDGRKLLIELGAMVNIQTNGKKSTQNLTKIGKMMAKMPIDPRLARMLIAGEQFGCLKEILVIVSALSVQDPRERPIDKQTQADQKHALFRQADSDFLFYISVWQAMYGNLFDENMVDETALLLAPSPYTNEKLSNSQRKNFAKKHFLSPPRLREWQQTHQQLLQMINELSLKINQEPANFIQIHRALLTGLLSFVAQKINDVDNQGKIIKNKRGEYLLARQHKAKIFPASSLFKQNPTWVMAFEIVETSQVFMRNLAKIEPEWILSAAGDLLKYHYFEPHWSVKTGQVKAYAQISLFGLIVVHKLLINYEKVNVLESHDIFLRDALVLGDLFAGDKQPPFLQHNLAKVANVALIEDKLRRRDLLVDEELLYQFYAKRVPNQIASRKAFEDWRKEMEKTDRKFLYFSDQDVLTDQAPETKAFPEVWQVGGLNLPLTYVFDPASDDDGVTIKVPLQALPQLDAIEILWGIAGWRYELVLQLLKTLPKDIRRQIVPIPDTADSIYQMLEKQHQTGLLKQLCQALNTKGIKVEPQDFNPQAVDRYLQPQIALVDDKNRLLDKDRDIERLKQRHQISTSQAIGTSKGLHEYFPEHFTFLQNRHTAGVLLKQFSALVANDKVSEKNLVAIHQFTDIGSAISAHRLGILALIKNHLGSRQKQLTGQIDKAFKMAFAPLGDLEKLKNILVDAALDATFSQFAPQWQYQTLFQQIAGQLSENDKKKLTSLPLNVVDFEVCQQTILNGFLVVGQQILPKLKQVYCQWQQIRQQLLMLDREIFGDNIDDIEDQLDDLHLADFIYRMDYLHWQQYPRYLQALQVRLERLPHNLDADLDGVYALDKHMERLATWACDQKISDYRWLVEEYRIQLFAQPMKTRLPVSEKRLENLWQGLMG